MNIEKPVKEITLLELYSFLNVDLSGQISNYLVNSQESSRSYDMNEHDNACESLLLTIRELPSLTKITLDSDLESKDKETVLTLYHIHTEILSTLMEIEGYLTMYEGAGEFQNMLAKHTLIYDSLTDYWKDVSNFVILLLTEITGAGLLSYVTSNENTSKEIEMWYGATVNAEQTALDTDDKFVISQTKVFESELGLAGSKVVIDTIESICDYKLTEINKLVNDSIETLIYKFYETGYLLSPSSVSLLRSLLREKLMLKYIKQEKENDESKSRETV